MSDGQIDYSNYALPDLRQALGGMDRERYPINFANLQAEIARRKASGESAVEIAGTRTEPQGRSPAAPVFLGICWFVFFWIASALVADIAATLAGTGEGKNLSVGWRAVGVLQLVFSILILRRREVLVGWEGQEPMVHIRGSWAVLFGVVSLGLAAMVLFFPERTVMNLGL